MKFKTGGWTMSPVWNRETSQLAQEWVFRILTGAATLLSIVVLLTILLAILFGGWQRLSWDFLFHPSVGVGTRGGVLYQIVGTLILILTAGLIVTPFATAIALLYTVFLRSARMKRALGISLHVVNSTPSILFGILGFVFFTQILGWDKSWLAGSIILALMILPTVTVSLVQRIQTIPRAYVEGAHGLGFDDGTLVRAVLLPYAWGGLLTGLVLGLARAAGETAPIMFTAAVVSGATVPSGIRDSPVLALPYHIFNLAQDVYGNGALETAWATAAVLTLVVLIVSAGVIPLRARSHEEAKL